MFNYLNGGHLSTVQRSKINQENEGIQLTHNKGISMNQSRVPGSAKQVFGDVKNKLDAKSTTTLGRFSNSKNSPFPSGLTNKTIHHDGLKPQKIQLHSGIFLKSTPIPTKAFKSSDVHEVIAPTSIHFHEENEEFNLDIDSLLDTLPIPIPKSENYGFVNNLFDFTDEEINDVMCQNIEEYQESPKLYNDDFNLHEIPIPTRDLSFGVLTQTQLICMTAEWENCNNSIKDQNGDDSPLCMNAEWETGNNSIMELYGDDTSCTSFSSSKAEALGEEDELPDFFTFLQP